MKRTLLFAGLMTLLAIPSFAVVQIDFTNGSAGSGGLITVSGSNISGSGVLIGSMTVVGAGAFDGSYDTFGTGAGVSNGSAVLNFDTATNFIEIIGGVCVQGNAICNGGAGTAVQSTTLLTGTFTTWTPLNTAFFGGLLAGQGPDVKSPLLLAALGLPTTTQFSYFAFNITGTSSGSGSPFTAISTDILNTSVPEPASIVLFGTVLFGVTQLLRRRAATKV